jgi:hypothetical protein
MQLTLINFFKKTVPGHIFRGKRRLVKVVTQKAMKQQVRDYELTERVRNKIKCDFNNFEFISIIMPSLLEHAVFTKSLHYSRKLNQNPVDNHVLIKLLLF